MEENTKVNEVVKEKTSIEKKADFDGIIKTYLESNPMFKKGYTTSELEIRFGTNPKVNKYISKIDYDNVVKYLYHHGFKTDNINGNQILRIQNEFIDKRTGVKKISNIRAELVGADMIQSYCKTNNLQKIIDMPSTTFNMIKFTQKKPALDKDGKTVQKVDMEDYNFRVSFQNEQDFHTHTPLARDILSKWEDSLKIFRAMNRVRFTHDTYPVFIDLSIVRSSKKKNKVVIPKYTIQDAGVFENVETYEIEIEVDNSRVGLNTPYEKAKDLADVLRKCIRIVMCGIQETNFPISYKEKNQVLEKYMQLIHGETNDRIARPKDFIGPGSFTLQMENITELKEDDNIPNIRDYYTVTDKADGERRLLYIAGDGKVYLIDTNMNVNFTGAKTNEKTLFYSLLDGEHIKYDKLGQFLNLYAAFDIYYKNKKSVRDLHFQTTELDVVEGEEKPKQGRLHILQDLINSLQIHSIMDKKSTGEVKPDKNSKNVPIQVKCKEFYVHSVEKPIFDGCMKILSNEKDGIYNYNTDGLIFTPARLSVGGTELNGPPGPLYKNTWSHSFKWKPPEFNTIDFLVSIKKDNTGKDEIHNIFQDGKNLQGTQDVLQYKTLVLRCGFDEKKHGYINPFNNILNDDIPKVDNIDNQETYKPVAFQPTNPFDENASICNVYLKQDGSKTFMISEEGEYFEENMIVEFKYEPSNEPGWRWIPLRVRYDKTTELRNGMKNYGNAYHVANSNWHSIHNPITEIMITTGLTIPEFVGNEDVYYNRSKMETSTQGLRDFHNLYVKSKLIAGVSNRGDTLIDYAVGKAGDLPKWIRSKLKFVFGVDISKDNILNQIDGACARYLNANKKYSKLPGAMFLHGNSNNNIRNGSAYYTEKDKQISKAIFGQGTKDVNVLGKGVYKHYGIGENGFQVSSCQFAVHYFFKDTHSLHSFIRNVAECTKVNGYFVGTCYDGKKVFQLLSEKKQDEGVAIFKENHKIFEITKKYDQTGFPDDETSLGYPINVYQETINKVFREYLVNFEYFVQIMEDYGFVLVTEEEAKQMELPNGSGLFSTLFASMENEVKMRPNKKSDYKEAIFMSPEEKRISFLNRYFIFKKMRNVDVKKLFEIFKISSQKSMEEFPGTPEGLPPQEQINRAVEKQVEYDEYTPKTPEDTPPSENMDSFPGTPEGLPPQEQINRVNEGQMNSFPGTPEGLPPREQIRIEKERDAVLKRTGKKLIIKRK